MELLGRYSSYAFWTKRVNQAQEHRRKEVTEPRLHRIVRKLPAEHVGALVAGYLAGATVYELAAEFKIHRSTVSEHLKRQGIDMRGQGLTRDQVREAAELYRNDWSLSRLGDRFEVDGTTVWRALRQTEVVMRKPSERGQGVRNG